MSSFAHLKETLSPEEPWEVTLIFLIEVQIHIAGLQIAMHFKQLEFK